MSTKIVVPIDFFSVLSGIESIADKKKMQLRVVLHLGNTLLFTCIKHAISMSTGWQKFLQLIQFIATV